MLLRTLAERRTPLPGVRGPELENVSGDSIRSTGEVYSVDFATGAAAVVQPVLSASHYSGPEGAFETLLRPPDTYRRKHLATGETIPSKWESGTLKPKEATCAAHEAKMPLETSPMYTESRHDARSRPKQSETSSVATGVPALIIWMKATEMYMYAALPRLSEAAKKRPTGKKREQ